MYLYSTFLCIYYIYKVRRKYNPRQQFSSSSVERQSADHEVLGSDLTRAPSSEVCSKMQILFLLIEDTWMCTHALELH